MQMQAFWDYGPQTPPGRHDGRRYPGTSPLSAFLLDNGRLVLPQPVQRYGWIYLTTQVARARCAASRLRYLSRSSKSPIQRALILCPPDHVNVSHGGQCWPCPAPLTIFHSDNHCNPGAACQEAAQPNPNHTLTYRGHPGCYRRYGISESQESMLGGFGPHTEKLAG
ncbi:hypothetical protein C8034_v008576 [Colletotrichum sidae]|uniref:Uncharacterized protein n=1 Tax=Colletotrichum sidae TaxID=1347389 RepID=A0A4R8TP20_9PEZI|nr:hypothetical protein C8034_v008576 [Colletotrichum sidae]